MLFISTVLTFAGLLGSHVFPSGIVAQAGNQVETLQPNQTATRSTFIDRIEAATVIVAARHSHRG